MRSVEETYFGYLDTVSDAQLLVLACDLGKIPTIKRQLSKKALRKIRSGSIYVWCEDKTNIRRWRDGKKWSSSRHFNPFLIYTQIVKETGSPSSSKEVSSEQTRSPVNNKKNNLPEVKKFDFSSDTNNQKNGKLDSGSKPFVASYLIKKSINLYRNGIKYRIISYYQPEDMYILPTPTCDNFFLPLLPINLSEFQTEATPSSNINKDNSATNFNSDLNFNLNELNSSNNVSDWKSKLYKSSHPKLNLTAKNVKFFNKFDQVKLDTNLILPTPSTPQSNTRRLEDTLALNQITKLNR